MKTLYLHIGRGKTGTTTLQAALSANREALLRAGVDYLRSGDRGGSGHQDFAKSFIARPPAFMTPVADPGEVREATKAEICGSSAAALLLSSENFPLADLDALQEWLFTLPIPLRVRVIFFVRSQDELAESEYNQMVKLKRETRSFADYAAALEGADYYAECSAWAKRFGAQSIIARIYDGAANDVIPRFLSCLPETAASVPDLPLKVSQGDYANRSLGARALLTARLLNEIEIADRDAIYRRIFAEFEQADLPAVLMNSDQALALRTRFATSNARFGIEYLGMEARMCNSDLGGRRYDDATRDRLYEAVCALNIVPGAEKG